MDYSKLEVFVIVSRECKTIKNLILFPELPFLKQNECIYFIKSEIQASIRKNLLS
jgi:hypothetical protein